MPTIFKRRGRPHFFVSWKHRDGRQYTFSTFTADRTEAEREAQRLMSMEQPHSRFIKWSPVALQMMEGYGCRVTRQNLMLADRAKTILETEPERFAWLLAPRPRISILAELGRCYDAGMKQLADTFCRVKPKALAAAIMAREFRGALKNAPQPGWVAVSAVRAQFPELTDGQIAEHLEKAAEFLRDFQVMTEAA